MVALGIGIDGSKHPLGLVEGSSENTTLVSDLLTGLRDRGLDTTDLRRHRRGAGAAGRCHPGVRSPGDRSVSAAQAASVADKLPDQLAATVIKRMRAAYHAESALLAETQLEALAKELERTPVAARSLREGLSETLTVLRPGGAADAGPDAAEHEQHRVVDLNLPQPFDEREGLAEREHGAALARGRDGRGGYGTHGRPLVPLPSSDYL